jgi:hypothetical protein
VRLPDLLTSDHLPAAELAALRLDGALYPVAGCWRPVDLPETDEARADAVTLVLRDRLVADRLTAAWVLGATDSAPVPLQACAPATDRGAVKTAAVDVRELHLRDADVLRIGSLRLTTALRTAADLLRAAEWGARESDAVRRLLRLCAGEGRDGREGPDGRDRRDGREGQDGQDGRDEVRELLLEGRFATHRKRALTRLAALPR